MYPSFPPIDAEIIIIGAGISGMCAAFYILQREPTLTVLILEATNRIGGRTLTIPLKIAEVNHHQSFDFGGQFVSLSQAHLIDLIYKLDLELATPPSKKGKTICNLEKDTIRMISKNSLGFQNHSEQMELIRFFEKIHNMGKNVTFINPFAEINSAELDSQTMENFITSHLSSISTQNLIRHLIRISCGVEPSQMTVLFYLVYCNAMEGIENQFLTQDDDQKRWIQGGADQICQKIASRIGRKFITTNDPVIEITRDPFQVMIETQNEIYQCKYVILAIPPKEVLSITFNPPLDRNRLKILRTIDVGHLIKFVVTYKSAFWREKGFTGDIISCGKEGGHGPIHGCYDITYKNWPALTGYIASVDCLEQPVATYETEVLQQLATYFGEEALDRIDYYEKCWLAEPYIYNCTMICPGIGNMDVYPAIRRPLGRLFWAGTETATSWNGFMGGAVQAGYRAAVEVLYECRPQTLTTEDITFIHSKQRRRSGLADTLRSYGNNWKVVVPAFALISALLYYRGLLPSLKQ